MLLTLNHLETILQEFLFCQWKPSYQGRGSDHLWVFLPSALFLSIWTHGWSSLAWRWEQRPHNRGRRTREEPLPLPAGAQPASSATMSLFPALITVLTNITRTLCIYMHFTGHLLNKPLRKGFSLFLLFHVKKRKEKMEKQNTGSGERPVPCPATLEGTKDVGDLELTFSLRWFCSW